MSVQSGFTTAAAAAAAAAGAAAAMLVAWTAALRRSIWANAVVLTIDVRAASSAAPNAIFGVPADLGRSPREVADNMMSRSSTVKSNVRP